MNRYVREQLRQSNGAQWQAEPNLHKSGCLNAYHNSEGLIQCNFGEMFCSPHKLIARIRHRNLPAPEHTHVRQRQYHRIDSTGTSYALQTLWAGTVSPDS